MWNITRICEEAYGFRAEPNLHDAYSATLSMKVHDQRLDILAEVYMSYINQIEDYTRLLNEVRHFVKTLKREQQKDVCIVTFHCQGLSCFVGERILPTYVDSYGLEVIDSTFEEKIV